MKKLLSILFIIMLIITFIQIRNVYALYKDKISEDYLTSVGEWNVKVNGKDIVSPGETVEFEMTEQNIKYVDSEFKADGANVIAPNTEAYFEFLFNTDNTDVAVKYEIQVGNEDDDGNVGVIDSYRIYNISDNSPVVDTTDDDVDNAADDYDFELAYPLVFKINEITDTFGNYEISTNASDKGKITGTDVADGTYEKKNKVIEEKNSAKGVIPLQVSSDNCQDIVRVKFKWLMNETEEEKEKLNEMMKQLTDANNEEQLVKIAVPIKVSAIQYLGEDL